ncbi:MAG: phytoene desaturase family protein [Hyphomicrobium sp.]
MNTRQYDVAVIGGGHNGLTAAAYLARAGLSVVLLEKNPVVGGAALTEEFAPGFRNSVASYTVSLLNPKVIEELNLKQFGLEIIERPAGNFWPIDDETGVLLPYDTQRRIATIAALSEKDAKAYRHYAAALECSAAVLRDFVNRTPPNAGGGILDLVKGGAIGRRVLGLSIAEQRQLLELFTASASDFLGRWFENDFIKASFAYDGVVGAYASPQHPGTAYVLLHHCFGEVNGKTGVWGHAIGGMGAITQAMAKCAIARGAEIRTDAGVARVAIEEGRTAGVTLTSGETVRARSIAANVGAKLLFRDLVAPGDVADEARAPFLATKTGSGTFRMNVALSELPDFTCRPGTRQQEHHEAGIIIAPSLGYLEQAYSDARTFGWSKQPIIEMLIPSTIDATLAPIGRHVASLFVQHVAPRLPDGRSWENVAEREAFADLVIETITTYAPNFKASVLHRQLLSPLDLERRFGLVDGDIFHGQLSLGQLFSARPVLGHANYRLPVKGLYLCGSSAHPGGGVTGSPGRNAAREIARDFKLRRN